MTNAHCARIASLVAAVLFASTCFAEGEKNGGTWIDAGESMIVIPESRKVIAAYSKKLGTWDFAKLDEPLAANEKVANAGKVAAFQTSDSCYAYSADTGKWGRLSLDNNSTSRFQIDSDIVRLTMNDVIYVFGQNSEEWSGVSLVTGLQYEKTQ